MAEMLALTTMLYCTALRNRLELVWNASVHMDCFGCTGRALAHETKLLPMVMVNRVDVHTRVRLAFAAFQLAKKQPGCRGT